jgi:PadR family transcriptional regulator PadR
MSETNEFESTNLDTLLSTWEEVYKRGLLSFWILLLVQYKKSYAYEMAEKIVQVSQGSISADEKSIYRAFRRFEKAGILQSKRENSNVGPPRKYYFITQLGKRLLESFIERNLMIFYEPEIQSKIYDVLNRAVITNGDNHD